MNIGLLLLMFFILGIITCGAFFMLSKAKRRYDFKVPALILITIGLILLLFAIAWSISSLIEYENQAAGVGMLIFGGSGLVCCSLAAKFIDKNPKEL
ncbi:hypothetical protein K4L44_08155 [Halosquirtibacter laminarini]|uniref:Uncharacterized protein n=1 Tax=Halosquirtibacter laminarini TaxID=3374600 RepID=A0AC61NJ89_9BACT|nr:hypothetical protein K4L44_08155 [Prolixibacteraceae bacterium]